MDGNKYDVTPMAGMSEQERKAFLLGFRTAAMEAANWLVLHKNEEREGEQDPRFAHEDVIATQRECVEFYTGRAELAEEWARRIEDTGSHSDQCQVIEDAFLVVGAWAAPVVLTVMRGLMNK